MTFHADAFASASLSMPESDVDVADLAAWFDPGEKPVWRVRGLNGNDLVKIEMAERRGQAAAALAAAIESGAAKEITASVRALLGRTDDIEAVYAKQLEALVLGSVAPAISHEHAAKLGEAYPVVFKRLFNEINRLTGEGAHAEKKPRSSGRPPESATPAPSAGSSANPSTSSGPTSSPAVA